MLPKVTYWTGTWDPRREAISKEIELLRGLGGRRAPVVSFSSGQGSRVELRNRVVCLSTSQWPLLRALAPLAERTGDINHVFGALDTWHLLRAVRKPTILTVALPERQKAFADPAYVRCFVAESEATADVLRSRGVAECRLRLIYPGVDLHQYRPGPAPAAHPFRIIFASTPADPAEFDARGISLLVELARLCPEMEIVLLWRSWGDRDQARRALEQLRPPANLRVEQRNGREMPDVYRSAHAVACLYEDGFGKSCPNSVVEALACGLPALLSTGCGIGRLVERSGSGLMVARDPRKIAMAARALQARAQPFGRAARGLAETHFAVGTFLDAYAGLYRQVASGTLIDSSSSDLYAERVA